MKRFTEAMVEVWQRAFELAFSIYRWRDQDRQTALSILWEALEGMEVRLAAQDEADRHDPHHPSKARWNEVHWLQLLVYIKSERYEKQQEQAQSDSSLTEEDMIIRFIKHLVLITCRRNSFYVTLGLSRLLHRYTTPETMDIYDVVFQNPDRSTNKVDAYYRDRKKKLMEEMEKRFGGRLRLTHGPRGEKEFQPHEHTARHVDLVRHYLARFTPWDTVCAVPEALRAWDPVPALESNQANQVHSVLHPPCFSRIISALGFGPPDDRLAVPRLFMNGRSSGEGPPQGRRLPSELTPEEITATRQRLAGQSARRARIAPQYLSVRVDGVEQARIDLDQSSHVRLEAPEDAMLIELVARDAQGELLLAARVLSHDELADQPAPSSVVLEGGQQVSLSLSFSSGKASDTTVAVIDVSYKETSPVRALALAWRQLKHRLAESLRPASPLLRPALGLAAVALVASVVWFAWLREKPTEIGGGKPPSPPAQQSASPPPGVDTETARPSTTPPDERDRQEIAQGPRPGEATRDRQEQAVRSLLAVKRIYVEPLGDDAFSQAVRQKLRESLTATGRFTIVDDPKDADTALTGSAQQDGTRVDQPSGQELSTGRVQLELVNVSGDVVWPTTKQRQGRYRGTAEAVASQFVTHLRSEIQKAQRSEPEE